MASPTWCCTGPSVIPLYFVFVDWGVVPLVLDIVLYGLVFLDIVSLDSCYYKTLGEQVPVVSLTLSESG